MALPSNPDKGSGGTLSKIVGAVTGAAKGVGQQVTGSAAREEALEANAQRVKQVKLLEKIEENTRGMGGGGGDDDGEEKAEGKARGLLGSVMALFGAIKAFSFVGFVKGIFGGIFRFAGKAIMAGVRAIFNPKNLLKFVTRILPLAALFGALANGIWEAFNTFMSGGSIGEVIGSFLGGILEFLSFGLLDAEVVKEAFMNALNMFDEYIIQPLSNFFTNLGTTISTYWNDYVVDPITNTITFLGNIFTTVFETVSGLVETIGSYFNEYVTEPLGNLFNTYIIDPIKNIFGGVSDFFTGIFDKVLSFLEDFGIPAIGFDIPLYGPVEFGPWYPFRAEGSDEGATAIGASESFETTSSTGADGTTVETENAESYIKSVGSMRDENGNITDDETTILVESVEQRAVTDADGNTTGTIAEDSVMANFNATTGEATIDGEAVDMSVYRAAKFAAEDGGDVDAVRDAIAQQEAYLQLSWWRKARSLRGHDPRDLLAQQEGDDRALDEIAMSRMERSEAAQIGTGNAIDSSTSEVASAAQAGATTVTVVAPTSSSSTVNSNQNVAVTPNVRSGDSTVANYYASSAAG